MRNLAIAFFLNLVFTLIEIGGGLWTNSIAILSDALHDGGDCLSLGLAWWLQRVSLRGEDARLTYGYRRYSIVGALVTGGVLVVGLGFVGVEAIKRLSDPQPVRAPGMIVLALIGIAMNGFAALRVRGGTSFNERVATWHLFEDVLGWVAVLLGSIAMTYGASPILDPLLSVGISAFVLWNVVRNLRKVMHVLVQRAPAMFDVAWFEGELRSLPGALSAHHTHVWTLDGEHHVLTTHLVMHRETTRDEIARAKCRIRDLLDADAFEHVTVDVELEGDPCVSQPVSPVRTVQSGDQSMLPR